MLVCLFSVHSGYTVNKHLECHNLGVGTEKKAPIVTIARAINLFKATCQILAVEARDLLFWKRHKYSTLADYFSRYIGLALLM